MADQLDRDYELMTYNQHPVQLFFYRMQNRYLQQRKVKQDQIDKGEPTTEQSILADVE